MTAPPPPSPLRPSRWNISLRTAVALVMVAAVTYAVGITAFLGLRVAPAAAELHQGTEAVLYLFGELQDRARSLETATRAAHRLMAAQGQDSAAREAIADLPGVNPAIARTRPAAFAVVPAELQLALARADGDISRIQSGLAEILALDELGRYGAAAAPALAILDVYRDSLSLHLTDAQRYGLMDLIARERSLGDSADLAVRRVLGWLLIGVLLVPVALLYIHRRVNRPLKALDAAFARVSEGDLTARVPVARADEVGRLAEQFNRMTGVLQDRVEGQGRLAAVGELLAGVAHEVSDPLMAITALTERRLAEQDLPPERQVELLRILRQARRGARLLARVLRLAGPGRAGTADVDLTTVILEATDMVAHRCVAGEVIVENRIDLGMPHVRGDAVGLEQVFVNLLGNAIDAVADRPGARRITLTSSVLRDAVAVTIADTGPGVAPEIAADIFKPFATTKGARGSGLGLYLSRRIARAAGGDLALVSAPGQGARFVVTMPLSKSEAPATPAAAAPRTSTPGVGLAGIRVLIADDDEHVRREVAEHLRQRGATIAEVGDGAAALRILEESPIDVIVLDLRMPRMNWLSFLANLWRNHPELGERVVVLSGDPRLLAEVRSLAPRERVLAKPVELAVLEDSIRDTAMGVRR